MQNTNSLFALSIVLALLLPCHLALARFNWGKCPTNIKVMSGFDIHQYQGEWLEIARYRNPYECGVCQRATYTIDQSDTSKIRVNNTQYKKGKLRYATGNATQQEGEPAKWTVTFDNKHGKKNYKRTGSYWIIDTDYNNYAMVYSCNEGLYGLFHTQYAWILGRKVDSISDQMMTDIFNKWKAQGVNTRYFKYAQQKYCEVKKPKEPKDKEDKVQKLARFRIN